MVKCDENDPLVERTGKTGAEALYAYVQAPPATDSKQDVANYEKRILLFDEYSKKYTKLKRGSKAKSNGLKKMTFSMLFEFLDTFHITLAKCCEIMFGEPLIWTYPEMQQVANLCNTLTVSDKNQFKQALLDLVPDSVLKISQTEMPKNERIYRVTTQLFSTRERVNAPASYKRLCGRFTSDDITVLLDLRDYLDIANFFRLPLHWLMQADDSITMFGHKPFSQWFVDYYAFLSENDRLAMYAALRERKRLHG